MSKTRLLLTLVLAVALSGGVAAAADVAGGTQTTPDPKELLRTIRANRKALIAVNLNLSAEEGAKFWPVYERYEKEIAATGDRMTALVTEYIAGFATMSNEKALELVQQYLAADTDRLKVRTQFLPEFSKVLPGRTVARFYQIENKMDAVIKYDLAATIPVIDEKQASAPAK